MKVKVIGCMVLLVAMACFSEASVVVKVDFEEYAGDSDGYISNGDAVLDTSGNMYDGFLGGRLYADKDTFSKINSPLVSGANGGVAVDSSGNDMFVYLRDGQLRTGDGTTRPTSYTTPSPYFTLEATKSYTFEAMVKWDADNTDPINGIMGLAGATEFWLRENDGYLQWGMKDVSGVGAYRADININSLRTDNQWHHIALVLDRDLDQVRAYADGVLLHTDTNSAIAQLGEILNGTDDFCLGAYRSDAEGSSGQDLTITRFDGLQDAYAISDEVLAPGSFVVPEPATLALLGLGSLLTMRRRR